MAKHIQGTQEWLDMRRRYIGASDAPIIMGVSPWRTPFQLWQEKLGIGVQQEENFSMKRGSQMECEAREAFETITQLEMFPQVVFHPQQECLMCSLDGLTLDGKHAVEIKCPGKKAHKLAMEGTIPEYYMPQLQHQLACLDMDMIYYFSYKDRDSNKIIEVKRDDEYITKLIEQEKKFWEYVKTKTPPPLTDKDYCKKDDLDWIEMANKMISLDQEIKWLTKQKDELKKEFISAANNQSCRGGGITLTKTFVNGQVDYSSIPELDGVDLDHYRKPGKEGWTLRITKK